MRSRASVVLPRAAFGLLTFASFLLLVQADMEPGYLRGAVFRLETRALVLVLLLFSPALAARLKHSGSGTRLLHKECFFAGLIEAVLYGLMLIQPLAAWLVASLDQNVVAVFGITLPSIAPADSTIASEVNIVRELGAGLALILLALHVRNYGIGLRTAGPRSLAERQSPLSQKKTTNGAGTQILGASGSTLETRH